MSPAYQYHSPFAYSFYNMSVDILCTAVSLYASFFFVAYLRSRKPADKHILNRLMLINFYFKLLYYPLFYIGVYLGFQGQSKSYMAKLLSSTIASYSFGRILFIMMIAMYTLISASRALYFISPAKMQSLDAKFWQRMLMLMFVTLFVVEVILSQVVFSPARCDVNENGHELHTFSSYTFLFEPANSTNQTTDSDEILEDYLFFNQTNVYNQTFDYNNDQNIDDYEYLFSNKTLDNDQNFQNNRSVEAMVKSPKVCTLFPTLRILLFLMVICESTRLSVAIARLLKKRKRKRVAISLSNTQSVPAQLNVPPTTQTDVSVKMQTDVPETTQTDVPETTQSNILLLIQSDALPTIQSNVPVTLQTDASATMQTDVPVSLQTDVQPVIQSDTLLATLSNIPSDKPSDVPLATQSNDLQAIQDVLPIKSSDVPAALQTDVLVTKQFNALSVKPSHLDLLSTKQPFLPTTRTCFLPKTQSDVPLAILSDALPEIHIDIPSNEIIPAPSTTLALVHTQSCISSPSNNISSVHTNQGSYSNQEDPDAILSVPEEPLVSASFITSPSSPPCHPFAPEPTSPPGDVQTYAAIPSSVTILSFTKSSPNAFKQEAKETFGELKNIILLLVQRAYSLVIIISVLVLISFLLPIKLNFMRQVRMQTILLKLDLFFVPVFWILIDKDVSHFTEKKTKDIFLSVKMKFTEGLF